MTEETTGSSMFLIIIVLFFFFMLFAGGNGFGWGGNRVGAFLAGEAYGGNFGWNNQTLLSAICNSEKQGIIDSARTLNAIEAQGAAITNALSNKIDFYEYQNLRDRANAAEQRNMFLEGQINDIQRYNLLQNQIAEINCNMLKTPKVYGVGTVCQGSLVPSNLCPTTTTTTPTA